MNRTILASMVIIGLITGTVGVSTSAYFNDMESSSANTFTTGGLDLKLGWDERYNGEFRRTQDLDDNPGPIFDLSDVKPGDTGQATVNLRIFDNPGHLWMKVKETKDTEVSETEPERSMGDTDPDGELDDELMFRIWYDDGDQIKQDDEKTLYYGSARKMTKSNLGSGHYLADQFWNNETDSTNRYIGMEWWLPKDVGNRVQKDRVGYDFDFYTEQMRHNENPDNPFNQGDSGKHKPPAEKPEEPEEPEEPQQCREPEVTGKEFSADEISQAKYGYDFEGLSSETKCEMRKLYLNQPFRDGIALEDLRTREEISQDKWGQSFDELSNESRGEVNQIYRDQFIDSNSGDNDNSDSGAEYSVVQGDTTVNVTPIKGNITVEDLYDLRIPDRYTGDNGATDPGSGPYYQSAGTGNLQAAETSIMFLYEGPEGLSLVVVHDKGGGNGGSATWTLRNLSDGSWTVKDDLYIDPDTGQPASTNYDRWNVSGNPQVVDWTWGSGGTDGGVYTFQGDDLNFTIQPDFNEQATLWEQHYSGTIDDWQVLSGDRNNPNRTSLALDQPVTIRSN